MNSLFDGFTQQYPLSKTLRFELKPVGNTAKLITEFNDGLAESVIVKDEEKSKAYPFAKKILDDYYRDYISEVLSKAIPSTATLKQAFNCFKDCQSKSETIDMDSKKTEYKNLKSMLRKEISGFFGNESLELSAMFKGSKKSCAIFEYGELFKEASPLFVWLQNRLNNKVITLEEFEAQADIISKFNGFTTYFTKYKANRENLFANEEKASSIAFRVIDENMEKFFDNCLAYRKITRKYPDEELTVELLKCEQFFTPENYGSCLTQTGIDSYNQIIGRKSEETYGKGINQQINELRQKKALKRNDVPLMTLLFKQLMSESERAFIVETIENDGELFSTVKDAYNTCIKLVDRLTSLCATSLTGDNLMNIFIKTDGLSNLSHKVFGRWDVIDSALNFKKESIGQKKFDAKYSKVICLFDLQAICDDYISTLDDSEIKRNSRFSDYFKDFGATTIKDAYVEAEEVLNSSGIDRDKTMPESETNLGGKGYRQLQKIKQLLDAINEAVHFYKPFLLEKQGKAIETDDNNKEFYNEFLMHYRDLSYFPKTYDKVRNYATKKPYSKDKFLLNFDKPTLLDGWDVNKEESNLAVMLMKDGKYYLGIMKNNRLFADLSAIGTAGENTQVYEKLVYKQVSGACKMFPKVFFAAKNLDLYQPSDEIGTIREEKSHLKGGSEDSKNKWIQFCIDCIDKQPEWKTYFKFNFKKPEEYPDVNSFYKDADAQMYSIAFTIIPCEYVDKAVKNGELFLFELYNKDFSEHSKGRPNLHTLYWKMLFDENNLNNIMNNPNKGIFKLNGEAEIFYRKASLPEKVTHPANKPITNKTLLNDKGQSTFEYDIKKDRRYMSDKFMFHCPLTINFRKDKIGQGQFNTNVNEAIEQNLDDVNIIGIDRGERHLLYYTLINAKGDIVKQGSLNSVTADCGVTTDYRSKLDDKEKSRTAGRENWGQIETIKELKQGYLSQVVHMLSKLMIENNAVVVLEDLNSGFKNSRKKVEKQVYQNFEKALIDKLNFLVFKEKAIGEKGSCLEGYQLTAPFESFAKMSRQSGFLYYVMPAYTSKICPKTGFVDFLKPKYESVEKSIELFKKFDKVCYSAGADYFEFSFDYKKVGVDKGGKTKWTVCTYGKERYVYQGIGKEPKGIDITAELKDLFGFYNISFLEKEDLLSQILTIKEKSFWGSLVYLLKSTLQMRYTKPGTEDSNDYILSPVMANDGTFFDSRNATQTEPQNADANGAYHIALKGKKLISSIENGKSTDTGKLNEWLKFAQERC